MHIPFRFEFSGRFEFSAALNIIGELWTDIRRTTDAWFPWIGYGFGGWNHEDAILIFIRTRLELPDSLRTALNLAAGALPIKFVLSEPFTAIQAPHIGGG